MAIICTWTRLLLEYANLVVRAFERYRVVNVVSYDVACPCICERERSDRIFDYMHALALLK